MSKAKEKVSESVLEIAAEQAAADAARNDGPRCPDHPDAPQTENGCTAAGCTFLASRDAYEPPS